MRATTPTLHCDHDPCDAWTIDYYEVTASRVDDVPMTSTQRAPGWRSEDGEDFCPKHNGEDTR